MRLAGPYAAVTGKPRERVSQLATMVARLSLTVHGMDAEKERVQQLLPAEVAALVKQYTTILQADVATAAQYREAVSRACEANGVARARVRFAPD